MAAIDIAGQKFGRLTAIRRVQRVTSSGKRRSMWEYECTCGRRVVAEPSDVRMGRYVSAVAGNTHLYT
jgi:hypothetical protein